MPILEDGTVLPSFMRAIDRGSHTPAGGDMLDEVPLRVGEVISGFPPEDPGNSNGNEWEYVVQVSRRSRDGRVMPVPFRCVLSDGFGSKGDHRRHSLRVRTAEVPGQDVNNGAIVLIACVNADMNQGVIVACLRHPKRSKKDPKGRFYEFEFNGVNLSIADDGSFTLTVPGPTDVDGKPAGRDSKNKGTKLRFEKSGNVTLTDESGESIKVSPGSKSIEVQAGKKTTTIQSEWKLKAKKVTVIADEVELGDSGLNVEENGTVLGQGIDPFTGLTYSELGNVSRTVKVKE